ncbi:NYN domain-containing protein, partial [Patescibacteria group bacterium]|nr:NYN domain-containing protein [Patescibacteria group bacterium]
TLVFKPTLEIWKNNHKEMKGNVDGELILNAMAQYPNYDKAIVISGDGDYFCLLDYLDKRSKLTKIIVPDGKRYSSLLRKFSPKIVDINLHKNDICK